MKETKINHFTELFKFYIKQGLDSVLILGSGELRYEMSIPFKQALAVDWSTRTLQIAKHKRGVLVLKYDIKNICDILVDKSFDAVIMFDFIEHLEKEEALKLLKELETKVRKQIILFIPIQKELGYEQEEVNKLQEERKNNDSPMGYHLSLWHPKELEDLGYEGEYDLEYHKVKQMGAIFCVKNIEEKEYE